MAVPVSLLEKKVSVEHQEPDWSKTKFAIPDGIQQELYPTIEV